jgi:hypothetical protein
LFFGIGFQRSDRAFKDVDFSMMVQVGGGAVFPEIGFLFPMSTATAIITAALARNVNFAMPDDVEEMFVFIRIAALHTKRDEIKAARAAELAAYGDAGVIRESRMDELDECNRCLSHWQGVAKRRGF